MANPTFWSIALPTTAGAVVGAGIGVFGLQWLFYRESRERYETQLTDKLFQVSEEMRNLIPRSANFGSNLIVEVWGISAALKNVSMMARGADREMISLLSQVCDEKKAVDRVVVNNIYGFLIQIIAEWRNKNRSFDHCLRQAKKRISEK